MSGIRIPILSKQRFNYGHLGTGGTATVELHRAIDLTPFKSARLLLRVHDVAHSGGGGFTLNVYNTAPSDVDSTEFTAATAIMSCAVTSTSSAGDLVVDTDSDIGPFLKVSLAVAQDAGASQTLFAELSADLVVREN